MFHAFKDFTKFYFYFCDTTEIIGVCVCVFVTIGTYCIWFLHTIYNKCK